MIGSRFWCVQQTVVAGHTTAAGTLPFKLPRPCWLLSAPVDFLFACQSHCRLIGREKPEVWISDPTRSVVLQVGLVWCYLGGRSPLTIGPCHVIPGPDATGCLAVITPCMSTQQDGCSTRTHPVSPFNPPQVRADLRTIRSSQFASGYSLRFPRIERIR